MNAPPIAPDPAGARLRVHAVPRASRSEIAGLHGGALRVRLQAPPVDGKANRALLEFLAGRLGLPPRALALLSGEAGRHKTVRIAGLSPGEVARRLGLAQ